jgi:hypothetical protein
MVSARSSILTSRVLWSEHAKKSDWVAEEVARFQLVSHHEGQGPNRRLIPVFLDSTRAPSLAAIQGISAISATAAYDTGPAYAPPAVWDRVIETILEAVSGNALRIPLAVVASTEASFTRVDPGASPPFGESLGAALHRLGLSRSDVLKTYGSAPEQWTPIGASTTIAEYLNSVVGQINVLASERVRWRNVADALWSNNVNVFRDEAVSVLANGLSVVVLDCISLFDSGINSRMEQLLSGTVDNDACFILAFIPAVRAGLRDDLMQRGTRFGGRLSVLDVTEPSPELVTLFSQRLLEKTRKSFLELSR